MEGEKLETPLLHSKKGGGGKGGEEFLCAKKLPFFR